MVLIEPPAAERQLAMGDESVDSEALTQERIAPLGEIAGDFAQVDFDAEPAAAAESWLGGELPPASHPPLSRPPAFEGEADADDSVGAIPPIAFQSEAAARRRQFIAVGAIAGISLLLAATIFGLVVRNWRNGKQQVSQQVTEANENDSAGTDQVAASPVDPAATDGAVADTVDAEPKLTEPELAGPDGVAGPDGAAEPDGAAGEPVSPVGGSTLEGDDPFQGPTSPLGDGPLGDGPLGDGPTLQGGAAVDDATEGPMELPAGLQRFAPLLQLDEAAAANASNQAAAPPTMADLVIRR